MWIQNRVGNINLKGGIDLYHKTGIGAVLNNQQLQINNQQLQMEHITTKMPNKLQ